MNLAKYRKAQSDLDEAEERLAENAAELSSRARLKNAMSATATTRAGAGVRLFSLLVYPFICNFTRVRRTALSNQSNQSCQM